MRNSECFQDSDSYNEVIKFDSFHLWYLTNAYSRESKIILFCFTNTFYILLKTLIKINKINFDLHFNIIYCRKRFVKFVHVKFYFRWHYL